MLEELYNEKNFKNAWLLGNVNKLISFIIYNYNHKIISKEILATPLNLG